jgi:LDH2 family malate/lactate/ureidoglycolate dehydrogenase
MSGHCSPASLERWSAQVFASCGVAPAQAAEAGAMLVRSELRGYTTHGLTRMPAYAERLQSGEFNARPAMRHRAFAGGLVLDADGAMGHVAGPHAVRLGLGALDASASVLIAVQSCGHLGALGVHALLAAEAGALCMIGQRTPPLLALPGFGRAAIGHNPLAFSCPVPGAAPLVFDIACSVAARGHILLAAREGKPIPEGWALDEQGGPTLDAERALRGALLPMGGHKGIGIAMMVECLAGALAASAGSFGEERNRIQEGGAAGRQGAFLWMVKPQAFSDEALFGRYMAQWTSTYLDAGGDRARLPGARGDDLGRKARERGIELPAAIERELGALGARLGIPFPA